MHLFVYGSLRADSGHEMHRVLAEGASFVGKGSVPGRLYNFGWHPGAVRVGVGPSPAADGAVSFAALSAADPRVRGELYRLHDPESMLARLDDYEGCGPDDPEPHRFARERVHVLLDGGETIPSWIYWYRGDAGDAPRIESGDWASR